MRLNRYRVQEILKCLPKDFQNVGGQILSLSFKDVPPYKKFRDILKKSLSESLVKNKRVMSFRYDWMANQAN